MNSGTCYQDVFWLKVKLIIKNETGDYSRFPLPFYISSPPVTHLHIFRDRLSFPYSSFNSTMPGQTATSPPNVRSALPERRGNLLDSVRSLVRQIQPILKGHRLFL